MGSAADRTDLGKRVRLLVLANETLAGVALQSEITQRAGGPDVAVLVVCPALTNRLKHWLSDVDDAVTKASERLESSLAALRELGITADGRVGDGDPLQALRDAVRAFRPTEIVISTHPRGRSNWLEKNLVAHARDAFPIPVTHVVVDLEHGAQGRPEPAALPRGQTSVGEPARPPGHVTGSR